MQLAICTIFGKDAGGFAWENVFHVSTDYSGANSDFEQCVQLAAYLPTIVHTAYLAVMNDGCEILGYSARAFKPTPGITATHSNPGEGGRSVAAAVGAVNGRIAFVPDAPSTHVSSMFIPGVADGDYLNDVITSSYQTMLESLGDSFILIDGSESTYHWQLVQFHAKVGDTSDINEFFVSPNPTTLNKRIRA